MKLTSHAKQRMKEMGVDVGQVMAVVRYPLMSYPDPGPIPRRRLFGHDLVVVVEYPDPPKVITVLWRSDDRKISRADGRP